MTGVLGFLVQCEVCPQRALVAEQLDGWTCPRCTAVTDRAPAEDAPPVTGEELNGYLRAAGEFARTVLGAPYGAFGDVDVAQGEPLQEMRAADARVTARLDPYFRPATRPVRIPVDDPLAVAIRTEMENNPERPLINAVVRGATFEIRSYTEQIDAPLETEWISEVDLHAASVLPQRFRDVVVDDDGPDLGKIRG